MTINNRCSNWDCGWCYAKPGVNKNASNGACWAPHSCPENQRQAAAAAAELSKEKEHENN